MSENDKQVGGDHYKKCQFQPWDWERYGVGGLEWTAIKYITRYKEKGGVQDLHKALHYIDKLIEECRRNGRQNRVRHFSDFVIIDCLVEGYVAGWELNEDQQNAVKILLYWYDTIGLEAAKKHVQGLIDAYSASDVQPSQRGEGSSSF